MYYILKYKTVENYIERRIPFRDQHLTMVKEAHNNGFLIMAGALANPPDSALFIFKANDIEVVNAFAKNDPYVVNGLIPEWEVRQWNVVIGGEINA